MKLAVQKKSLKGQVLYRNPDPVKRRHIDFWRTFQFKFLGIYRSKFLILAKVVDLLPKRIKLNTDLVLVKVVPFGI